MMENTLEFVLLSMLFVLGAPLNVRALLRHCATRSQAQGQRALTPGIMCADDMERVQLHRNLVDLLVMLVCIPMKLALAITGQVFHMTSDVICKSAYFVSLFSFHSSSNLIVAIAVDRLLHIVLWEQLRRAHCCRPSTVLLSAAWTLAALCAMPALIFWKLRMFPLWYVKKRLHYRAVNMSDAINVSVCISNWEYDVQEAIYLNRTTAVSAQAMIIAHGYYYFHMVTMFWGPALCILVCYSIVIGYVCARGSALAHGDRQPLLAARRFRVCRVSTLLVVLYCLSWTPYCVVSLFDHSTLRKNVLFYFHHLMLLNSALNPLVYRTGGDAHGPIHPEVRQQPVARQSLPQRSLQYLRSTLSLPLPGDVASVSSTEMLDLSSKQPMSTPGYTNIFETE